MGCQYVKFDNLCSYEKYCKDKDSFSVGCSCSGEIVYGICKKPEMILND